MFTFYSDPGHGWLRVDVQSARSVGLEPNSFSKYSYQYAHWLYLEEDYDASLFVNAYMDKHNRAPVVKKIHHDGKSPIRNYERIAAYETNMTPRQFWTACRLHDWWYMMSDDDEVYRAGSDENSRLVQISKTSSELADIYEAWRVHEHECGARPDEPKLEE